MLTLLVLLLLCLGLLYFGHGFLSWVVTGVVAFTWWGLRGGTDSLGFWILAPLFGAVVLLFGFAPLRRAIFSARALRVLAKVMPQISETERIALEAGTVWWDAELFSGRPRWRVLLDAKARALSAEEQAFLDGPVQELCAMLDDWQIRTNGDLPEPVWEHLKRHGYFGMIVPRQFGGLEFSARANSAVIARVASRSVTAAVTVMVPNSLGPAELLLHYGTDAQKQHYLPRLARGEEVPCFALTEPGAGSDAASMTSRGIVCRGRFADAEVLGMRLTWNKRYITLAPVATVLGLAFKLADPEHLLGEVDELGITCALIPTSVPGVEIGRRHDPLGVPFMNGPTTGHDVFVPLDFIIGGPAMAGKGWLMLMQCLAAGRGISLPALSCGASQLATRAMGAYATVREQFNVAIGKLEGIEDRLARIGGLNYAMNAARHLTTAAIDLGQKPAVITAIVKAYLTEGMRTVVNDAMDVQAGGAICQGPRNFMSSSYCAVPIGITVEGANILTRTLIIYGQGALRCHPYVRAQVDAVATGNLKAFDRALFKHIGFTSSNFVRAAALGLSAGRLAVAPAGVGSARRYYQQLSRASAAFVTLSDVAMALLGGSLKRREKISGRFADALAWMYLGSASLKAFHDGGQRDDELAFLRYSLEHALYETHEAFSGILDHLASRPLGWALKTLLFPFGVRRKRPSDRVGAQIAAALLAGGDLAGRLSPDLYCPPASEVGLGQLLAAADTIRSAHVVHQKVRESVQSGRLASKPRETLAARAFEANLITRDELALVEAARKVRDTVVQVDAFESRPAPQHVS
ncbi:MAG: acyl-CoA dehydrogenase [Planctomycetota bacterium]